MAEACALSDTSGPAIPSLHLVTWHNESPAVIAALLDAGADSMTQDGSGETPWDYAQERESLKNTDAYWRLNEARFR